MPMCQSNFVRFIHDMVILESSCKLSNCLKTSLYKSIHTDIKLGVYVWVDYYCRFKIVSMIEDLCMIGHAFKSVMFVLKATMYNRSGLIVD
jgi:hypothetical protein